MSSSLRDTPSVDLPVHLSVHLEEALARRSTLSLDTDAFRLFDAEGEGHARLVVERYADAVRVTGAPMDIEVLDTVREVFPTPLFYRFGNDQTGHPSGDSGQREVCEQGLRFGVSLIEHRNTGLFLDARPARAWVRSNSSGRRVLNLFAFTSSFGVAAAAGGARSTVNVDTVPGALARGRENYEKNGLTFDSRTFWRSDVFEAVKRATQSGARFEGIVLDPPPMPTGGRRGARVEVRLDLGRLLRACRPVMTDDAWLMLLVANRSLDGEEIAAAAGYGPPKERLTSGEDFVAAEGSRKLDVLVF